MVLPKQIKGILFDFDGVLGKTMEDHFRGWKKVMSDFGITITEDDYYPLEGMKLTDVAKTLCKLYNSNIKDYESIVKTKIRYYLDDNNFEFYDGVLEYLDYLTEQKIRKVIVTGSVIEQLRMTVGNDFLSKFDAVISSDIVKHGKPHPEPYLLGLEALRLKPEECVVIENAPLGIKSAKAAGIFCIAIASTVDKEELKETEADNVVDTFKDLKSSIH